MSEELTRTDGSSPALAGTARSSVGRELAARASRAAAQAHVGRARNKAKEGMSRPTQVGGCVRRHGVSDCYRLR